MTEVEIKAHVYDFAQLKNRIELREDTSFPEALHKIDTYYYREGSDPDTTLFRLRQERGIGLITRKIKNRIDSMEVNEEIEFTVSDIRSCSTFFSSLGYTVYVNKEKQGYLYHLDDLNIELWHVTSLGDFIELEVLLPPEGRTKSQLLKATQKRLYSLLDELLIPRGSIEPRYYMELLRSS